ncbi:MAG: NAD(+) synthase [Desulfovibrionaceae bacterium]
MPESSASFRPRAFSDFGYVRLACLSPRLTPGDVPRNLAAIRDGLDQAAEAGASLAFFPELCLTGYTCADLFLQDRLLVAARAALPELARATAETGLGAVVGLPLVVDGRLYNCAAFLAEGRVLGLVPKIYLPTTNEYYEQRWFTSGAGTSGEARLGETIVPFGVDLLFCARGIPECVLGIEICEDLWTVCPPSGELALAGATILVNPSASVELLGKAGYRRDLVRQQSGRCLAAYAYAAAGPGESTTDVVFSGHSLIAENSQLLAEAERFRFDTTCICADVDVKNLVQERIRNSSFSAALPASSHRRVAFDLMPRPLPQTLLRPLSPTPFVPADPTQRAASCREIFQIQSTGLMRRMLHTGLTKVVLGISGGLDSTMALIATVTVFDRMGLPRENIHCLTMPGFGTTERTWTNAETLVTKLGARLSVVPIHDALNQHFKDIGFDPANLGVTYENAQARERTQILMDVANMDGALVVGTGDLSEAALGWCTFNGDHMSMYHINAGVPKTLIRYLAEWSADEVLGPEAAATVRDICATPITPELLPLGADGSLVQCTEQVIGPYELHDFFLFMTLRHGFGPAKILFLAERAFGDAYDRATLGRWLETFIRRFFSQQFKRSSMPDGPKVGTVALSPRGDWRMPSDASPAVWLEELRAALREE